jgi:lysophospholipase L1-like esterase
MTWPLALFGLLVFCVGGCNEADRAAAPPAPGPAPAPAATGGSLRYLALGDSYTKGEGVPAAERWPVQLAAKLRAAGLDVADPQIIAETGWRTDDLDAGITEANPQGPFDLVTLLIGVNNQFQGRSVEAYRGEFDALLRRATDLAGGDPSRVVVLSIPDWGATPYGQTQDAATVGRAIDRFNVVNRELSRRAGARYVDVTPVSRTAVADPALTAPDDLHPSGKMYAAWVELAFPEAGKALAGPATVSD